MPAPDLSTRQIALLFKDLVHYICFRCSCTVFTNNFLSISIFHPALRQQGFPKLMPAGDLSKLKISKTFYTHYTKVASLDFGEIQTQKTIFFEVRSSLFLHHPVIENCLFQCAVKQPIKLMSWTIYFCANILQKEFNLLQMEQVDSWLHPSLVCEGFLALRCSLTSPLVASLTSSQIYKHILALKEFPQTICICLFRKKAFDFELLFYCLLFAKLLLWILTCLTSAQPSHTYKNWANHEMRTTYQKWSRISLWLWWISERAFVH